MNIRLAYGHHGLSVDFPDALTTIIEPQYRRGIPHSEESAALTRALREPLNSPPLRERVSPADRVVIVICDITRAIPTSRLLLPLLAELQSSRVPDESILILNATGTHRINTRDELAAMVGAEVLARYRVENHEAQDSQAHLSVGTTRGGRTVAVDSRFLDASVRILTGFIEPHFFAGYSGGPKMVVPGVASLETVMQLHDAELIASPQAHWGITNGNPLWEEIHRATELALAHPASDGKPAFTFNLNVTLNRDQDITNIFAGELDASHRAGCEFARAVAMQAVRAPFDIVVTTNSGYPLDLNLYQTVKGMSAAAEIVREGGDIVVASECSDGFPAHGKYRWLLEQGSTPDELLKMIQRPGFSVHDQWQVQIQAQIQKRARVFVHANGLSADDLIAAHFIPTRDVQATVRDLVKERGGNASICVLPEGPQTIPYVS